MDLLGNGNVRARLTAMAASERLHQCLLFEGASGLGKASTALWLARYTNCTAEVSQRPCGGCWSCQQIPKGNHPDVIVVGLDPERTAPVISVKQARNIVSSLSLRPYQARRRFVIIDPVEAMTTQAANALLKTFEEPPASTGFILITSRVHQLLSTVLSRSQRIRFRPVPQLELADWVREQGIEQPAQIALLADGCPGQALTLGDGEAAKWRGTRDQLLDVISGPIDELFGFTEKMVKSKSRAVYMVSVERFLDTLCCLLRDCLLIRAFGEGELNTRDRLYNSDCVPVLEAWASALDYSGIERIQGAIDGARKDLAAYVNTRLLLDALLVRLCTELGSARTAGRAS